MIKKSIKSFNFVVKNDETILLGSLNTIPDDNIVGHLLQTNVDGVTGWVNTVPNDFTVRLDIPNHPDPQFVLHADGDAIFTGRVHSLGSVMWNQVLNRLEFWDGTNWIPINT